MSKTKKSSSTKRKISAPKVSFSSGVNLSSKKSKTSSQPFRFNRTLSKPNVSIKRIPSVQNDLNMLAQDNPSNVSTTSSRSMLKTDSKSSCTSGKQYSWNGTSSSSSSKLKADNHTSNGTSSSRTSSAKVRKKKSIT